MLAFNPKSVTDDAGDQAILHQVVLLSQHAKRFYQRVASATGDNNLRRHFLALTMLHQQAEQFNDGEPTKLVPDAAHSIICQWYQSQSAALAADKATGLAELAAQLQRQLAIFKRYSRELAQPANAKAMANLTAGLQIVVDALQPALTGK